MSLRTCINCGELITSGSRCEDCKPARQRNGWAWTVKRKRHLALQPACVDCASTDDVEVHHRTPLHAGGTDDPDNLETRCTDCHQRIHAVGGPKNHADL